MKSKFAVVALVALLVLVSAVPALAVDGAGTINITGGPLAVTPQAVTFVAKQLNGTLLSTTGDTDPWTAVDPTGTGAGWHLTIIASDFTAEGGKVIPAEGLMMQLLDSNIAKVEATSSDVPESDMTAFTAIDTVQTFATAEADEGMGTYSLDPSFTLAIPANTKIGSYSATLTVQIVSAPS